MSQYKAITVDGKTLWLPQQQEAQPTPSATKRKPATQYPTKRTGKRYGERKTWY